MSQKDPASNETMAFPFNFHAEEAPDRASAKVTTSLSEVSGASS